MHAMAPGSSVALHAGHSDPLADPSGVLAGTGTAADDGGAGRLAGPDCSGRVGVRGGELGAAVGGLRTVVVAAAATACRAASGATVKGF